MPVFPICSEWVKESLVLQRLLFAFLSHTKLVNAVAATNCLSLRVYPLVFIKSKPRISLDLLYGCIFSLPILRHSEIPDFH